MLPADLAPVLQFGDMMSVQILAALYQCHLLSTQHTHCRTDKHITVSSTARHMKLELQEVRERKREREREIERERERERQGTRRLQEVKLHCRCTCLHALRNGSDDQQSRTGCALCCAPAQPCAASGALAPGAMASRQSRCLAPQASRAPADLPQPWRR